MKGSIAKAARVFDALRIKLESGTPSAPAAPVEVVAEEVAEEIAEEVAEVVEEVASPEPVKEEE